MEAELTHNELASAVMDLLEAIAEYAREPFDENWNKIIMQSIQIDSMIAESYSQLNEEQND
jgi:hypothetical protein